MMGGVPRTSLAAAIRAVAERDPVVAHLVAVAGPIKHRPGDPDGHFGALVRAITFQQLAGPAARAIHRRVRALVDGPLTPEALAALPDDALRGAGLSANKLASLRDLSTKVLDGTVVLDASTRAADDDIVAGLTTVRGIGRWTAEMYLMFELRRLDVWPVDDLGVRQGYGLAWRLDPPPTAKALGAAGRPVPPVPQRGGPLLLGGGRTCSGAAPTPASAEAPIRYRFGAMTKSVPGTPVHLSGADT